MDKILPCVNGKNCGWSYLMMERTNTTVHNATKHPVRAMITQSHIVLSRLSDIFYLPTEVFLNMFLEVFLAMMHIYCKIQCNIFSYMVLIAPTLKWLDLHFFSQHSRQLFVKTLNKLHRQATRK